MPPRIKVMPGERYGRWVIVNEVEFNNAGSRKFICKCDCGTMRAVRLTHLRQGVSKSCGCLGGELSRKRATKHGYAGTALYACWQDMIKRCINPKHKRYKDWGGRGISICKEWMDIESFVKWAQASGYKEELLLERIDNDGNYEPSNCRWATMQEQGNNRRDNRFIAYKGETKTLTQWSRKLGLSSSALSERLKRGWTIQKALETPKQVQFDRSRFN